MSNVKHTHGPWLCDAECQMRQQIAASGGVTIFAYSDRYNNYLALCSIKPNEVFGGVDAAIANSRLIAAAPCMLAALKTARAVLSKRPKSRPKSADRALAEIDDAITKAEGV